jgi:hypothetical protein
LLLNSYSLLKKNSERFEWFLTEKIHFESQILTLFDKASKLGKASRDAYNPGGWVIWKTFWKSGLRMFSLLRFMATCILIWHTLEEYMSTIVSQRSSLKLASFVFFGHKGWIQPLALTAEFHSSVTIRNFKKLQYIRLKAIENLK